MSDLRDRVNILDGKRQEMLRRKSALIIVNEKEQQILTWNNPVIERLSVIQEEAVAQSAGVYNELLTAIVQDVMNDVDQRIILETKVKNNKTQLHIGSEKNGIKEDIVEDRGGSINNLISAGLRFIAIVQSGNRRFIALDEQDCWLEERLVPKFIQVLERLSNEIGVQCVFISHHDKEMIQSTCNSIEFVLQQGKIQVIEHKAGNDINKSDTIKKMGAEFFEGTGLRYITLENIMSHEHTTINLAPSLTAIIGGNDIGKSVVIRAIDACKNNKPQVNLIAHGHDTGIVKIGVEEGMELIWSINSKRTTKPQYTLLDQAKNIIKTEEVRPGNVPSWVDNILSMSTEKKIDAHISHQKDPLFILNPAISPAQRAEMVDLGTEFHIVQKMFELHNERTKECRKAIKRNIVEINEINTTLERYEALSPISEVVDDLNKKQIELFKEKEKITESKVWVGELKNYNVSTIDLTNLSKKLTSHIDHKSVKRMQDIHQQLSKPVIDMPDNLTKLITKTFEQKTIDPLKESLYIISELTSDEKAFEISQKLLSKISGSIEPIKTGANKALVMINQCDDEINDLNAKKFKTLAEQREVDVTWNEAVIEHGDECPCPTCGHQIIMSPAMNP